MKKKIFILILAGLVLAATGCGKKNSDQTSSLSEQSSDTDTSSAKKDATIVYTNDNVQLAEYKNLTATKNIYTVTEDSLNERIQETLAEYADYNEVDRASQEGDYVTIMFTGTADGEKVIDYADDAYEIILGDAEYGTEFDQKLTGVKSGDTLDFTISYPSEEDSSEDEISELAGKTVDYHVEVTSISEEVIPEYTDDFVKENTEFDTKEAFEQDMKTSMEEEYTQASESELRETLINEVIESSTVTQYSEETYQSYYDAVMADYEGYAEMFGMTTDELISSFNMTDEDIKTETLDYLYRDLIVAAIAENENLSVSDEEFNTGAEQYAAEYEADDVSSFLEEYGEDNIRNWLLEEKVLDLLEENADITEVNAEYPTEE